MYAYGCGGAFGCGQGEKQQGVKVGAGRPGSSRTTCRRGSGETRPERKQRQKRCGGWRGGVEARPRVPGSGKADGSRPGGGESVDRFLCVPVVRPRSAGARWFARADGGGERDIVVDCALAEPYVAEPAKWEAAAGTAVLNSYGPMK